MAVVLGVTDTIERIVEEVEKLDEIERKILLAQLKADQLLKKGIKKITQNPADVPMHIIDKWKHDSRKKK